MSLASSSSSSLVELEQANHSARSSLSLNVLTAETPSSSSRPASLTPNSSSSVEKSPSSDSKRASRKRHGSCDGDDRQCSTHWKRYDTNIDDAAVTQQVETFLQTLHTVHKDAQQYCIGREKFNGANFKLVHNASDGAATTQQRSFMYEQAYEFITEYNRHSTDSCDDSNTDMNVDIGYVYVTSDMVQPIKKYGLQTLEDQRQNPDVIDDDSYGSSSNSNEGICLSDNPYSYHGYEHGCIVARIKGKTSVDVEYKHQHEYDQITLLRNSYQTFILAMFPSELIHVLSQQNPIGNDMVESYHHAMQHGVLDVCFNKNKHCNSFVKNPSQRPILHYGAERFPVAAIREKQLKTTFQRQKLVRNLITPVHNAKTVLKVTEMVPVPPTETITYQPTSVPQPASSTKFAKTKTPPASPTTPLTHYHMKQLLAFNSLSVSASPKCCNICNDKDSTPRTPATPHMYRNNNCTAASSNDDSPPFRKNPNTGPMPASTMTTTFISTDDTPTIPSTSLLSNSNTATPYYFAVTKNGIISITYVVDAGYGPSLPSPSDKSPLPYTCWSTTKFTSKLPNTNCGRGLLKRLRWAFQHGHTFVVEADAARTSNTNSCVAWSGIPHLVDDAASHDLFETVCSHSTHWSEYFHEVEMVLNSLYVPSASAL